VIIVMTTQCGRAETMNKATIGFTNPRAKPATRIADIKTPVHARVPQTAWMR
jgi:hypothetical protein